MYFLYLLLVKKIVLLSIIPLILTHHLQIIDLKNDPVLVLDIRKSKIQIGTIKMIHPINLTQLDISLRNIEKISFQVTDPKSDFHNLINHKIRSLFDDLSELQSNRGQRRSKRWDFIGTTWKWIAGSPDADDLRMINTSLNELVLQNNGQFVVNKMMNQRMDDITRSINEIAKQTNQLKTTTVEMEQVKLLFNIEILETILDNIQDAILGSKVGLPSGKILTLMEFESIEKLLRQQGILTTSLEQILEYVEPKVATKGELLLYVLQIPQVSDTPVDVLQFQPLPLNNRIITNIPKYVIRKGYHLYTTTKPDAMIQRDGDISEIGDSCVKSLLDNTKGTCDTLPHKETDVKMIATDKVLITGAEGGIMNSSCGINNRKLFGNFLVMIKNCSMTFNGTTLNSTDIISKVKSIHGLFHETQIQVRQLEKLDIQNVHSETIKNREKLNSIHLRQFHHSIFIMILTVNTTIAVIAVIALVTYRYWKKKKPFQIQQEPTEEREMVEMKLDKQTEPLEVETSGTQTVDLRQPITVERVPF